MDLSFWRSSTISLFFWRSSNYGRITIGDELLLVSSKPIGDDSKKWQQRSIFSDYMTILVSLTTGEQNRRCHSWKSEWACVNNKDEHLQLHEVRSLEMWLRVEVVAP